MKRSLITLASAALFVVPGTVARAQSEAAGEYPDPVAMSPGDASKATMVGDSCPTFSWGSAPGATGYELVVYRLGENGEEEPVLRLAFASSVSSWTPSLDRCLERGGRYAWSVRGIDTQKAGTWSGARLFEVAALPSELEIETAPQAAQHYIADLGGEASPNNLGLELGEPLAPSGDPALQVNDAAVVTVESRGTVLLMGRVLGESSTPSWAVGAYTSTGDALPTITDEGGAGSYLVALPGGELFDINSHGVVCIPIEYGSLRSCVIERGSGGTIDVNIYDAAGARADEDFQIMVFNN